MNTLLNQVAAYLWQQSWQLAILIGIASLVCWSLRHKSAHLRYMVWLVVLAKCLVPPIFQMPVALLPAQAMVQFVQTQGLTEFDLQASGSAPKKTVVSETTRASWYNHALVLVDRHWMVMTWGVIVILMSVISLFRMIRIRTHLHGHRTGVSKSVQDDLETVCERFGLAKHPNLWLLDQTDQPFVWGWWAGTIYVPDGFESNAPEQRSAILAHELAHVCRYDAAVNLLQVLAQCLFWFHPLVWWANAQIRKAREQCCDEMAVAHMKIDVKTYCNALISHLVAQNRHPLPMVSLAISSPVKHIEQRIRTIMNETQFRTRPPAMAVLTTVLAALLLISTSCSLCRKPMDVPEEYLATEEYILISALVFKSSDGGKEIAGFLEEEGVTPLAQSGRVSACLTTAQQERFKTLSHIQKVASPTTHAQDGKVAKLSVITEEYLMLNPDSYPQETMCVESGLKLEVTPHLQEAEHDMVLNIDLEIMGTAPSVKSVLPIVTRSKFSNTYRLDQNSGILLIGPPHGDDPSLNIIITARKVRLTADGAETTE